MLKRTSILLAVLLAGSLMAHAHGVNKSIRIGDGEDYDGDCTSVNGGITIGDNAVVNKRCSSVNGGVRVGMNSEVEEISVVNGGISIGDGSRIRGEVTSVNGRIELDRGARANRVTTVNGRIQLTGAEVRGDLSTYNGDITLRERASVGGNIVIEESRGGRRNDRDRTLMIEIEDGSTVAGDIINEDRRLRVEVHLRGGGRVEGRVEGARVVRD